MNQSFSRIFSNEFHYSNFEVKNSKFVVTVDTEADNAWTNPTELNLENMKAIKPFQALCDTYGIKPTYLITYECATRDEAIGVLKPISDSGKCEIGHHLHVWSTPPFHKDNGKGVDVEWLHAYQSELPDSLFFEKANQLKDAITKNYGVIPKSHRAGRWGIDNRSIKWLLKHDFKVDTSILPLTDFSGMIGKKKYGPNFFFESFTPYFIEQNNYKIIEVPVTVCSNPNFLIKTLQRIVNKKIIDSKKAYKIIRKFGGGTKLTPNLDFAKLYEKTILKKLNKGNRIINFSLHSSEVSFGHSPITATEESFSKYMNSIELVFKLVSKLGLKTIGISEL